MFSLQFDKYRRSSLATSVLPLAKSTYLVRQEVVKQLDRMRRNQFEQQFQDSQANFSEVPAERADDRLDGHPVQLLRVLNNGKIQITEQAITIIASCTSEIGFVSVVGKMRTGKSCLLNRLLGLAGKGFKVDSATSSCTQGIWMWSQPIFNPTLNCFVFFLDTEGTNSLQKNPQVDAKIMTLSLLISSYFVFNSIGNIDERSISELEMVTALSQHIRADQKLSQRQNQQQLYRYMPKFIWALRDFTLKIEDSKNRKISPTQYLQNCLNDQQSGAIDQNSRKIKKSLLNYFKDRECITFVRPVGDQYELQRLNSIPDHALRREFVDAVGSLREKLVKGCGPKTFGGEPVNGPLMADLIDSFVDTFNNNKVPSIRSAWQQVAEDEGTTAYNAAIFKYQQVFREQFPNDDPKSDEEMRKILTRLREETMKEFELNCYSQKQEDYKVKLKKLFEQKQANIIEINRNVCEAKNNEILKNYAQKIRTKILNGSYSGKKQEMQNDLDDVIAKYNLEAKGATKAEILAEFIRNITPLMFSLDEDKSKQDEELRKAKIKQDELERTNRLKEKEIESLRQQLAAKDRPLPMPQGGGKAGKDGIKPPKEPKESQGCCSGDKCIIM